LIQALIFSPLGLGSSLKNF